MFDYLLAAGRCKDPGSVNGPDALRPTRYILIYLCIRRKYAYYLYMHVLFIYMTRCDSARQEQKKRQRKQLEHARTRVVTRTSSAPVHSTTVLLLLLATTAFSSHVRPRTFSKNGTEYYDFSCETDQKGLRSKVAFTSLRVLARSTSHLEHK